MLMWLMNMGFAGGTAAPAPEQEQAPVVGGAVPPWIPTADEIRKISKAKQVARELREKAPEEIAEKVEKALKPFYKESPMEKPAIDFAELTKDYATLALMIELYQQMITHERLVLIDDERVIELLVSSGAII